MKNHIQNRFKKQGYEDFRFEADPEIWLTGTNFLSYKDYLEGWNIAKDEYETLIYEEKENRRRACPFYQLREKIAELCNTNMDDSIIEILEDMLTLIEGNSN